ncbi:UDP-4-amino-4,6-dideoxy-N-acetyl-beta-L-altrosamine transaminase [Hyphobacterium marinum]|uniref:UDP-4-amino-4, 6-dideoxy-N-acetyl-beta-L-altrosamine transaminase n=1 Tax=Hyphobacterium marinum TaxID=3116574 RepID=A0ABU7M189_9PROT|nr:UDP-4-amino-4,6-dideoxy-N-acetyl-beta-L-altrosamine transaminase [Hyphobacterium sp. Y6023]MEE2567030.1 UDP-4-amino-4,6-dideoxy-N-acetyl-beta-L-altrosamine transaminase [Hyphobacterium sp. Y6023]
MTGRFLPYGRQMIGEDDIAAVNRVLRGDMLTTGPEIPAFEAALQGVTGAAHARACSSGTSALHLALAGLGVGDGDTCIVPAITFMATANAARYCGADNVFADVDPDTGLMTPETLRAAIKRASGPVRAVLPVHLAGQCADMAGIAAIARGAGAFVVEDACHALGTETADGSVGNCAHSDAACFSFHPVKTIACGEGGAVTTNDAALAGRIDILRSHGITRDPEAFDGDPDEPWRHEMIALGWNYRMTDIQAALGRSQLTKLNAFAARRHELAECYDRAFDGLTPLARPLSRMPDCKPCWHLYVVLIDFEAAGKSRADVMRALAERGIGTQVHYMPVPSQPYYRELQGDQTPPGAARYYARCLSLPLFAGMEDGDPEFVAAALKEVLEP